MTVCSLCSGVVVYPNLPALLRLVRPGREVIENKHSNLYRTSPHAWIIFRLIAHATTRVTYVVSTSVDSLFAMTLLPVLADPPAVSDVVHQPDGGAEGVGGDDQGRGAFENKYSTISRVNASV